MSIKKIVLGFALVWILGATSAVAEKAGLFAGVQLTKSWIDSSYSVQRYYWWAYPTEGDGEDKSGLRFGAVVGYYVPLDEKMGVRAYIMGDLGKNLYNLNANADFLFTLLQLEKVEFRVFAGAYVGGVFITDMETPYYRSSVSDDKEMTMGIDAGLNAGLRVVIADRHGIDFFYRYGLLEANIENKYSHWWYGTIKTTWKVQQSQAGIRYTFTF